MDMNINKVSGLDVVNTGSDGEIATDKKQSISGGHTGKVNDKIVDVISKESIPVNKVRNKPVLNKNNENQTGKTSEKTKSNFSLNELCSLLTDFYSDEKIKFNYRAHGYNNTFLSGLWSGEKESQLSGMISDSAHVVNGYIDSMADYYFQMMEKNSHLLSEFPDGELKNKLTGNGVEKFNSKAEIILYLKHRTNSDEVIKNINSESEYCKDKTKLFNSFSDALNTLPISDDESGLRLSDERNEINTDLTSLDVLAEIQDDAKDILKDIVNLFGVQRKSDVDYSKSLTVLMGKLADLRDKLAQNKLDNDRQIASIQQRTLQDKVDADSAEMAKKIEKAERLQALFKWLGPLLIALMVILTALTGGLLAKVLAAVVVVVTIINEIIKATGGPDIMAKIMTPVTKLVEVIQKFIKNIAMELGKAMGKSPEELKKLEEVMNIVSMLLAVVVVMAVFMAAGAVAGKVIGQVASETVKEVLKQVLAEVKKILITMMLTSTVINSVNSVAQAKMNESAMKLQADIDLDQELLDKIMALMEKIMATFSESQQELSKFKEKLSKMGRDAFQRERAIIQQGPLAV